MYFKRLCSPNDEMYKKAIALYNESFPYHEKREEKSQIEILKNSLYHFLLAFDNESFIGLVLYWENDGFIYVEHLCVMKEKRNQHYGEKILNELKRENKVIILEIDPPIDEIAKRRELFYDCCGFKTNDFSHIHPSYHKDCSGHLLRIMSYPNVLRKKEYSLFYAFLKEEVMKDVC